MNFYYLIDMVNQKKHTKKIDYSKLSPKIRMRLQKKPKGLFPIQIPPEVRKDLESDKLKEKIKCYRCEHNKAKLVCGICEKPICGRCETENPEGYCVPCRNEHFVIVVPSLE